MFPTPWQITIYIRIMILCNYYYYNKLPHELTQEKIKHTNQCTYRCMYKHTIKSAFIVKKLNVYKTIQNVNIM